MLFLSTKTLEEVDTFILAAFLCSTVGTTLGFFRLLLGNMFKYTLYVGNVVCL